MAISGVSFVMDEFIPGRLARFNVVKQVGAQKSRWALWNLHNHGLSSDDLDNFRVAFAAGCEQSSVAPDDLLTVLMGDLNLHRGPLLSVRPEPSPASAPRRHRSRWGHFALGFVESYTFGPWFPHEVQFEATVSISFGRVLRFHPQLDVQAYGLEGRCHLRPSGYAQAWAQRPLPCCSLFHLMPIYAHQGTTNSTVHCQASPISP